MMAKMMGLKDLESGRAMGYGLLFSGRRMSR